MIKVEDMLMLVVFGYYWDTFGGKGPTILLATLMGGYKSKFKTKGKRIVWNQIVCHYI